nr:hypothetical protein Iba_chr14cCG5380 [Ipomoea batatas]
MATKSTKLRVISVVGLVVSGVGRRRCQVMRLGWRGTGLVCSGLQKQECRLLVDVCVHVIGIDSGADFSCHPKKDNIEFIARKQQRTNDLQQRQTAYAPVHLLHHEERQTTYNIFAVKSSIFFCFTASSSTIHKCSIFFYFSIVEIAHHKFQIQVFVPERICHYQPRNMRM